MLGLWIGCASRQSAPYRTSVALPTTYQVPQKLTVSAIAERFYGADSELATHCLWHANPVIRNLGWVPAGQSLTIPVLPDQSLPFSPGETLHIYPTSIADPPYGFDAVISADGTVKLLLGITVRVAGCTPRQASTVIQKEYVPKYFSRWDMAVMRVQQAD